jgi:hypothetical protein
MGQHYLVVNLRKRKYIQAHKFNDGRKLLEFGAAGAGTMMGLAVLLADGNGRGGGDLNSESPLIGSWAGDPIVIAGDYADDGKYVSTEDLAAYRASASQDQAVIAWLGKKGLTVRGHTPTLYAVASQCYEDISDKVILALCDDAWERKALIAKGAEAAKTWKEPTNGDLFSLE